MASELSRRSFLGVAAGLAASAGCNNKQQEAAGIGATGLGTVMVVVPHPIVQVIGCVLIAGGTALVVKVKLTDGSIAEEQVAVTPEQKDKIERGAGVVVRDSSGAESQGPKVQTK